MKKIIEVNQLSHSFGSRQVLNNLNFDIYQGEILGLLGPNGAGKTTTIRILNGLFPASQGQIKVMGFNPSLDGAKIRQMTGVLTETPALYERLSARQNLEFFGRMNDMPDSLLHQRIDELLDLFDLSSRANDRAGNFSKGMKQRLALVRALLHQPPLLFLDEPTSGLDPEAAQQVHDLIESIRTQGQHTVVLCTHHLHEAEGLCDRVLIINQGQLMGIGTVDQLRQQFYPETWVEIKLWQSDFEVLIPLFLSINGVLNVRTSGRAEGRVQVSGEAVIPNLISSLVQKGVNLLSVKQEEASLERIYFSIQNNHNGETL